MTEKSNEEREKKPLELQSSQHFSPTEYPDKQASCQNAIKKMKFSGESRRSTRKAKVSTILNGPPTFSKKDQNVII